ncbi:replication associated protein [Lake Sarah-associated circular virus-51]|uniref:replication associated protein n=1 Tax=Lake Sarah-associated circular virus-51 TaxID=1685781 RepID=UPI0007780678|nr:replication associated protein [Lake Sarah-associated circular virus-51]ALE29838.1 replication associated protein [Lake Sarah-associated circular virus-51]
MQNTHASSDEEVEAGPSRTFRIDARHLELTYSRCNATVEDITEFLETTVASSAQCHSWFAAREYHQDGVPHYHILVKFNKRRTFRNSREYDFNGHHPRIKPVRNVHDYFRYISDPSKPSRDTTFASTGWMDPIPRDGARGGGRGRRDDDLGGDGCTWGDIVRADGKDEYFTLLKLHKPRDYCLNLQRLEYTASRLFTAITPYVPEYEYDTFNVPEELHEWATVGRHLQPRPKSLIICGPSRIGKTEWARSIGLHTYWYGQCNIDSWNDKMEYLIMDDFSPEITKYLPLWKGYFGAQKELNVTQKYRGIYTKLFRVPVLWLCNQIPILKDWEQEWLNMNADTYFINDKLYG